MKPSDSKDIDPARYKGILPTHMRQGIPPYLQILFASREPLPFVAPIKKPHKLEPKSFFDNINYQETLRKIEENARQRKEQEARYLENHTHKIPPAMMYEKRFEKWSEKMDDHIDKQKNNYKQWLRIEVQTENGKSSDPYKTLIVSNLVNLKEL